MTTSQNLRLLTRRRVAGFVAACCLAFSPPLHAAVTVETFTDYQAFLNLLGQSAQVVTFDDVPTAPNPNVPAFVTPGFGFFDPNRYAAQGIMIQAEGGYPTVSSVGPPAVSPPNVYFASAEGPFRDQSFVSFTHDGQPATTSAFGTFFIGNEGTYLFPGVNFASVSAYGAGGALLGAGQPGFAPTAFLGLATVDSVTGQLVPAIDQIVVNAGDRPIVESDLDNFTFASPVPVPEGGPAALFAGAMLAAVGLYRRRARASA